MKLTTHDKYLSRDSILITTLIYLFYWLIHICYINLHFLDHDNQTREDSDVNDLVYSKLGGIEKGNKISQDIFLVNIGTANRDQIAEMIEKVAIRNPKVIGLDISFSSQKDTFNTKLQSTLKKLEDKLVLGGYFTYKNDSEIGTFIQSDSVYRQRISTGYTNFVTNYSQGTVRRFTPFVKIDSTSVEIPSFASALLNKYSIKSYNKFRTRNNSSEIINYKYRLSNFLVLSQEDLLKNNFALDIQDKIVIFGFIGENTKNHSLEDYHYTPLNENGNFPDMPGVAIHANIIHMLITENFINNAPSWFIYLLSFIICVFHVRWFLWSFVKKHIWFHLHFKVIQFVSLAIIVLSSIILYKYFNLRIETSIIAVPIVLAVDILYFSEAIAQWIYKKYKISSYFLGVPHH